MSESALRGAMSRKTSKRPKPQFRVRNTMPAPRTEFDTIIKGRHPVHYETLPHDKNCPDPKHCDCDCHGCVHARNGKVLSEKNRAWFIKTYGLPIRYLCAKDNYQIPEAY